MYSLQVLYIGLIVLCTRPGPYRSRPTYVLGPGHTEVGLLTYTFHGAFGSQSDPTPDNGR